MASFFLFISSSCLADAQKKIDPFEIDRIFAQKDTDPEILFIESSKKNTGEYLQKAVLRDRSLDQGNAIGIRTIIKQKHEKTKYIVQENLLNCKNKAMLETTLHYDADGKLVFKANEINKLVDERFKDAALRACLSKN